MRRHLRAATASALIALLASAGCGGGSTDESSTDNGTSQSTPDTTSYPTTKKSACQVLTEKVARKLLGDVGAESAPTPDTASKDLTTSSCVRTNTAAGFEKAESVSLLMRVAKTAAGAESNESAFGTGSLPSGSEQVDGYGDTAFWNPAFGQLNVLANGNWYILSVGPIDAKKHTLPETRELADALRKDL